MKEGYLQVEGEQAHEIGSEDKRLSREELPSGLCRILNRQRQMPRIHKTTVFPGGQ